MHPPSFALVSGLEHTSHGALALALAAEFDDGVDVAAVETALVDLAACLAPVAAASASAQLALAGDVLASELAARPNRTSATLDDLLFHRVALAGRGQAMVCALVAVEAARLVGLHLGIVASRSGAYVGHAHAGGAQLLVPERGWLPVDARDLGDDDLAWHCPHESAGIVLGMILARGRRTGMVGIQVRAAELCLALPVEDAEHQRLEQQLKRARARLN